MRRLLLAEAGVRDRGGGWAAGAWGTSESVRVGLVRVRRVGAAPLTTCRLQKHVGLMTPVLLTGRRFTTYVHPLPAPVTGARLALCVRVVPVSVGGACVASCVHPVPVSVAGVCLTMFGRLVLAPLSRPGPWKYVGLAVACEW
ncbi:hypothetical protein ACQHIV_01675 [Kribbella sp. GL6]|uniref:hypothetical protein n=1 Tax=Kribbella sp. GL6 TaxID=3419765 RepID=UPI003CFC734C